MINFDDFITKYTGQVVDFDGIYPDQCMDLMHQYVYDVLGLTDKTILASPAAATVYTNFDNVSGHEHFTKIDNTPDGIPQKGDIVFFGTAIGPYGHVCIFHDGDTNQFNSFDANWPIGSTPHIQNHNYNGVLGWLRFIPESIPAPAPTFPAYFSTLLQENNLDINNEGEMRAFWQQALEYNAAINDKQAAQDQAGRLQDQLNTAQTTITEQTKEIAGLHMDVAELQSQVQSGNTTPTTLPTITPTPVPVQEDSTSTPPAPKSHWYDGLLKALHQL